MSPSSCIQRLRGSERSLLHGFMALDRHPAWSLSWRLILVGLLFRPWAWRHEPVAFDLSLLAPDLVNASRAAGVDPLSPEGWPTFGGVVLRLMIPALAFVFLWWGLSRLRRRVAHHLGSGVWAGLIPVAGYILAQLGVEFLLDQNWIASPDTFSNAIPLWQGWAVHPLLWEPALRATLCYLNLLGLLLGELLIHVSEGRILLQEAQAGALRARLTPHFLYNALNTLMAQIPKDPEGAQATTQRLSGLFEQVSQATKRPQVPLGEELALVEDFLALERCRLGDRLKVTLDVPDEWLDVPVPVLGLQVLVENALKHAISPLPQGGAVGIRAWEEDYHLWVAVTDSGDGFSRAGNGTGQALDNLRARLASPSDLTLERVAQGFEARFRVALT